MKLSALKPLFILFSLIFLTPTFAESGLFIDQKDQRFYDLGLIPKGNTSSLCGPVSFLNLILSDLEDDGKISKNDADYLLQKTVENSKELLVSEKINVNNGLQEYELLKYIEHFQKTVTLPIHTESVQKRYQNYGNSFFSKNLTPEAFKRKAHEAEKQIWLIKLQEIKMRPPYSSKKPIHDFDPGMGPGFGEDEPQRLFHFISKIRTNKNNTFEFIDPENPNEKLIMELSFELDPVTKKEIRILRSKSPNAFKNFWLRPPYRVELISLIAE